MPPSSTRSGSEIRLGAVLLAITVAITVACVVLYQAQSSTIEQRLRERESLLLDSVTQTFRDEWIGVVNDLRGLIQGDGLQDFLASGTSANLARAGDRAAFFARLHREYARLRLLDLECRTLFLASAAGSTRPAAPLPDVTTAPYFRSALALADGEVLISSPWKASDAGAPVISVVTPVVDRSGARRGLYVIDCRGAALVERLRTSSPTLRRRLRVLDAGGIWLAAPTAPQDWTATPVLDATPRPTAAVPAWTEALRSPEGQRRSEGGLLTWRQFSPDRFLREDLPPIRFQNNFVLLGSAVSAEEWADLFTVTRRGFLVLTPLVFALVGICAWLWGSHHRSVRSLRRSEERLAVTLDSIGDAVLTTDPSGRITRMNPVAEHLTGWPLAEARGRPIAEVFRIVHSGTRQPAEIPVAAVLASGQTQTLAQHTVLIARDGTERPVADSAAPIREAGGHLRGVVLVFRDVTTERRGEEAQARFAAIVESTEDAILTKTLDGTITSWNPAAARMFGYAADEIVGRPISLIVPPELLEEDDRARQDVVHRRTAHFLETRRFRRDGSTLDVAITLSPLADSEGVVTGVSSIIRDTTRARHAAEQLRRSADEIRDLYNSAPCGYHSLDADGRIIAINDTELAWLGYRREEVVGRLKMTDLLSDEGRALFADTFPRFKRDGAMRDVELRLRRRDGTYFHGLINATGIFDSAGRFVSSRSTVFDITARKEAEEELERFFSISLDFLCISSGDGYFKRVSPAVTDILGWTVDEFLARPYLDLVHPDDVPATLREVERQLLHGEKVLQFENRYLHKDGTWRILSWRSTPQPGGLMYATARDVTENRRAENEVRQLHAELARHAARLELTNKELESFSYSVSHDLRAPLRHIRGYVEMLARDSADRLSEKSRRYLGVIGDAAREMGQLIDDLLLFSRMGRTDLHETSLDLNPIAADVRQDLSLSAPERSIEWRFALLPPLQGDPAMLRQVLVNLLGNAVKYTRPRSPAIIELGLHGTDDSGQLILFVRDNGVGFDMRYADKLFGVFQRLHRADEFEGTGIGLASVHRIIVRHGGRIWAESAPDAGATFFFTLKPALPTTTDPQP